MLLGDTEGLAKTTGRGRPTIIPHQALEAYLGRYAGLMLYLKEMDESVYGRLCAVSRTSHNKLPKFQIQAFLQAYFSAASELHGTQIKALFSIYMTYVKKAPEEDLEQS